MESYYTVCLAADLEQGHFLMGKRADRHSPITEFEVIELPPLPDMQRTDSFFVMLVSDDDGQDFDMTYIATYKVFDDEEADLLDIIEAGKINPVESANEILASFVKSPT